MKILSLILVILVLVVSTESAASNNIFSSIFSFGKKKPTSTPTPSYSKASASTSRCGVQASQCSAYECCNFDQTCLRNRCFPRLSNCPVTRDQCGNACCKTSEQCRNGKCSR
ncbi:uncharacterized protein CELE_D2007.1 [Caenorhabditis elegans]|uniref:Uncharacterized protein D2007.1 n=1 Tax=Caenorhabditis elegans TaxID=6239 RepID=YLM1_CAEEL|nr:Uncharacterized protein CELE_D2007.1 [Caenorhabditis elegans]P34375.1 RecName: Full=Uncharacterized protein D2007.1 [Caenorhabditis elegans]CCD64446.1 Uncharacterized protein CELE_D2007.1 [Caenorhabditis elegans]|eukprot:NP_498781.1 Uncharacterized protein CELE_D2007.1 [Caenorhabditis elegans]